jgi:hypothetical protein
MSRTLGERYNHRVKTTTKCDNCRKKIDVKHDIHFMVEYLTLCGPCYTKSVRKNDVKGT